jgi:hypothetical protein
MWTNPGPVLGFDSYFHRNAPLSPMKEGARVHHSYGSYAPSSYGSYDARKANPSTAQVRAERLAIIAEVLEHYDVDGFELAMNYVPYYFRPEEAAAAAELMTAFVAEVQPPTAKTFS